MIHRRSFSVIELDTYTVNGCSVFLILRNDAGHNGVDLCCLKIIKAHVHSADGHGLPCHLNDSVRAG